MAETRPNSKLAANILTVVTFITYVVVLIVNAFAAQGPKGPFKFLHNTTGGLSDKYYLEITPAGWTFSIWGFIYTWQALWLIYSLTLICRSHVPVVLTPFFFTLYIVSNFLNASWLLVFGVEEINGASIILFASQAFLYAALATVYRRVSELDGGKEELKKGDFIAVQSLVINGIAFYSTWVSIAALLNLAMVLTYTGGMEQENACTISLVILTCEIIAWFILDLTVLKKMTKYTLSPWIVLVIALIGSISKNFVPGKRNSIITVVLLCIVGVLAVARLVAFAYAVYKQKKTVKQNCKIYLL